MDEKSEENETSNLYDPVSQEYIGNKPNKRKALGKAQQILTQSLKNAENEDWDKIKMTDKYIHCIKLNHNYFLF